VSLGEAYLPRVPKVMLRVGNRHEGAGVRSVVQLVLLNDEGGCQDGKALDCRKYLAKIVVGRIDDLFGRESKLCREWFFKEGWRKMRLSGWTLPADPSSQSPPAWTHHGNTHLSFEAVFLLVRGGQVHHRPKGSRSHQQDEEEAAPGPRDVPVLGIVPVRDPVLGRREGRRARAAGGGGIGPIVVLTRAAAPTGALTLEPLAIVMVIGFDALDRGCQSNTIMLGYGADHGVVSKLTLDE
jgi:hypothetical protein